MIVPQKLYLYTTSGFTQKQHDYTGTVILHSKMVKFRRPEVSVALREWNHDWESEAERIATHYKMTGVYPKICYFGYSWGIGNGLVEFAEELSKRGFNIDYAVSCDGVYRSRFLSFRWLSITRIPTITIPDNVKEVYWFRQFKDGLLQGHDLESNNQLHDPIVIQTNHSYADESLKYHDKSLEIAERYANMV